MIAKILGLPFYRLSQEEAANPSHAFREIVQFAQNKGYDPLIVDTAGRLHIDEDLMRELRLVKDILCPTEVLYVGDAMTGQDAVKSAQVFEEKIGLDSVVLTKLDGDARGGAALSIVAVTGKPIKFIGTGEKFDKFEVFYPDRMASRILGMGDVLSLIEKVEQETDLEEAEEFARRLRKQEFTLEDFKKQLTHLKKMGSLSQVMSLMPDVGPFKGMSKLNIEDRKILHFEAIINSMTPRERENPKIINGSCRLRIAKGSGRPVSEINQLLKQFFEMRKLMKKPYFQRLLSSRPLSH